jgi:hypothetical protein
MVRIADTPGDMVLAIEAALSENADERAATVDPFLSWISWDRTWTRMHALVQEATAIPASPAFEVRLVRRRRRYVRHLVVGARLAGAVLAERLASQANRKILVVDKRNHIGGNAYDCYDDAGILVHRYGPHIFHANSREMQGVPDPEPGLVYESWIIPPGKQPVAAGITARGDAKVPLPGDVRGTTVAITKERSKVDAPTTTPLMATTVQS